MHLFLTLTVLLGLTQTLNTMEAYGIVEAAKKITLKPSVSGRLIEVSSCFDLGCIIDEGELLAKIDPAAFITEVEVESAHVKKVECEYKLEIGRQRLAESEWELIGKSFEGRKSEDMIIRKPHLDDKKAQLQAAEKKREKAERNLKNTEIRAPFNAIIINDSAFIGQMVTPDVSVGELVSIDKFRVIIKFPFDKLCKEGCLAGNGFYGQKVSVIQDLGDFKEEWEGTVVRLLSSLEEGDAKVLIEIEDPLSRKNPEKHLVPLLLGSRVLVVF